MKKSFILLAIVAFTCNSFAQEAPTLTATVMRTKHNTAITNDMVTQGSFYFRKPDKMSITFDEGKDMLLMEGNTFTIINDEKSSTAKGKQASQLELLQRVLVDILSGGDGCIDTSQHKEMEIAREDTTIRIIPVAANAKAMRRMMFTSFTLTVDPKSSELKSICMHEKGGNYTLYDFTDYVIL